MLYAALIESDCPVWIIFSDRRRDKETIWQLYIYSNLIAYIQIAHELALVFRIIHDMVINTPVRFYGINTKFSANRRISKDLFAIPVIENIVGDVFDDNTGFLIVDDCGSL